MAKLFEHIKDLSTIKKWQEKHPKLLGTFRYWILNKTASLESVCTLKGSRVLLPNLSSMKVLMSAEDALIFEPEKTYEFGYEIIDAPNCIFR